MRLRRPLVLFVERRDRAAFSLEDIFAGGDGLPGESAWVALAPHLDAEVDVSLEDLAVLDALGPTREAPRSELEARFGVTRVAALREVGLLLDVEPASPATLESPQPEAWDARDRAADTAGWWGPALLAQRFGRWEGADIAADEARWGKLQLGALIEERGPPPAETLSLRAPAERQTLPPPRRSALDALLQSRATCRNFDPAAAVPLADLADLLHRVFGAQSTQTLAPGAVMLKKNSPSGGGLHPVEAYVLVQRVDGLAPGLYHYHPVAHALEPLGELTPTDAAVFGHVLVAGQPWFANAPVLVLMAARYDRSFWKYRRHAKAWRVVQLDAGHLSQVLYLAATELGHGAFVTAAINDGDAERAFGLDGVAIAPLLVSGFGPRTANVATVEFDPLGKAVGRPAPG